MFNVRLFASAAALAVFVAALQITPVAASAQTESSAVYSFASQQLNKPFQLGADGMRRFDCSGLVYRTYFETGLLKRISGRARTSRGYYYWFRDHGLVTKNPKPGDLVVWAHKGKPVSHIGIFIGYNNHGQAMAISALTTGVAKHRVNGISVPLKAYLSVNLQR